MLLDKQERQMIKKIMKKPRGSWKEIDVKAMGGPSWMTRAYKNNHFAVMIDDERETTQGKARLVMIRRHDEKVIPNHWSEIQRIKTELFGPETMAVEYYPKHSELMDVANIYWIFIYPEGVIPVPDMSTM